MKRLSILGIVLALFVLAVSACAPAPSPAVPVAPAVPRPAPAPAAAPAQPKGAAPGEAPTAAEEARLIVREARISVLVNDVSASATA
ncbi:MAG: hypothetical protein HY704_14680, partial [Gemmatimonadetes bacterium]|nr:hypothetical protein [Gemmatimonadota bacterium]